MAARNAVPTTLLLMCAATLGCPIPGPGGTSSSTSSSSGSAAQDAGGHVHDDGGTVGESDGGTVVDDGGVGNDDGGAGGDDAGAGDADGGAGGDDGGTGSDGGLTAPDAGVFEPTQGEWDSTMIIPGFGGDGARVTTIVKGDNGDIYVGGLFTAVNGAPALNVARWDGDQWHALGDGLDGMVMSLALGPDGALYAGGELVVDGLTGTAVAKWDGSTWTYLPGEFTMTDWPVSIRSLLFDGNRLYVTGAFEAIDGGTAAGVAVLDEGIWVPLARGQPIIGNSLLRNTGGDICVGGMFESIDGVTANNVACLNGQTWTSLGPPPPQTENDPPQGLPGEVRVLRQGPDGAYYAGGYFVFMLDPNAGIYRVGLARLENNVWVPWAGGVDGGFINVVRALEFDGAGRAYVGGCFASVGEGGDVVLSPYVAYRENNAWQTMGTGLANRLGFFLGEVIGAHAVLPEPDGTAWIGGIFSEADGIPVQNLVRWGGASFEPVKAAAQEFNGVNGLLNVVAPDREGGLLVGGWFNGVAGVRATNIAHRRADGTWEPLADGLNSTVRAILRAANGDIYAGGEFYESGDAQVSFLARYRAGAWEAVGALLDGQVTALAEGPDGTIYVGGDFLAAGATGLNRVARLENDTLVAMHDGFDGRVTSLLVKSDGALFAGGLFQSSGARTVRGVAEWKGGQWEQVGSGLNGAEYDYASTLALIGGELLVGGSFDEIDGQSLPGMAVWDGAAWHNLGGGVSSANGGLVLVTSAYEYRGGAFVTGIFDQAGSVPASFVAYWDGANWHALDEGLNDLAESLVVSGDSLWVGGPFTGAGGRPCHGIARWVMEPAQ
ncbi:MAG: hypothetical protein AB2A00_01580 [Myxococcota bacterium]